MNQAIRKVLGAVAALLLIAPAPAAARADGPRADPLRTLGADSPLCKEPVGPDARRACAQAGAVEHAYPLDRYRFDWHIDTGVTKVENNLTATLQWLAALVWQAVLYAAKCVLLLFQWAFSLDLLGEAMQPVRRALLALHERTFGRPWMLAGLSVLAIWALWHGVLRARTTQTVAGLAVAVVLLASAQAMVYRPAETIGVASQTVNDVKGAVLAGATAGTVRSPARSVADASRRVFDAIVLRPWCAIQFGDVAWCLDRAPGDRLSRAERWLRFDVGSEQRDAEYRALADPDFRPGHRRLADDDQAERRQFAGYTVADRDRAKVEMQQQDNTLLRCGLIVVIALGVLGWIALLGYLSAQTLLQALYALLLVMFAPAMAFMCCLGEWGRRIATGWLKRLAGALAAGAFYALLLAIVLTLVAAVAELYTLSWLLVWGVQALLLWFIFAKRDELLDWLAGRLDKRTSGGRLSSVYHAKKLAETATAPAVAVATAGAAAPWRAAHAGATRVRDERVGRTVDETLAVQATAREVIADQARARLEDRYADTHARLSAHDDAREKFAAINKRLAAYDRRRATPTTDKDGTPKPVVPSAEERKLIAQRRNLEKKLLPRTEEGVARKFVEAADRNLVEQGQRFTDKQVELQADELRRDITDELDPAGDRHAWRGRRYQAGLPAADLDKLTDAQRDDLTRAHIADDLARDRALFAALPEDPELQPDRAARQAAIRVLPKDEVRERAADLRAQRHHDRRHVPPRRPNRPDRR